MSNRWSKMISDHNSTKTNLALAILVLIMFSCGKEEEKVEEVLRPVQYQVVGTFDAQKIRTFSGVAKPGDEKDLSFRSNGIMTVLNIRVGQQVKRGDLIAQLDNVQANLAYEQSVSGLSSAESTMFTSKTNLERTKLLYEKGSESLSSYENAKNDYQNALSQYESALRNKEIQESQIDYGFIYAPSDGVIASRDTELNENVSAGQVIGVLNAGAQINIEVGIPENVINGISLEMETDISFSAFQDTFKGTVIEIAPSLDPNTATYLVKIEILNATSSIRPGMAANVTVNLSAQVTEDNSIVIPVKAVGEDGDGNFVLIIDTIDDETAMIKKQKVEIGELTGNGFKILKGISEGQKIATAGLQTLLNGQKVRL